VPLQQILDKAQEEQVDIIGLSGLITPSLDEMVYVAQEMEKRGMNTPLLIGGATTSRIHTAVKIVPEYTGPIVHVLDASKAVPVAQNLLSENEDQRAKYALEIKGEYEKMREGHLKRRQAKKILTLGEARANKLQVDWSQPIASAPSFIGNRVFTNYDLETISQYIDWTPFFYTWELKGKYPEILEDPDKGPEANKLFDDAKEMLLRIIDEEWLEARAVVGFYPANTVEEDDIELYADESRTSVIGRFCNPRQQAERKGPNLCLADFVAPKETGLPDYIGGFAVTTGLGIEKKLAEFEADHDDYNSIMLKALADRLAEAFAEMLHREVRRDLWGYAPGERFSQQELIREKYQGIRPAPGYPANPDHTEKETLFRLLDVSNHTGISLTESLAMYPTASVSGLYFSHPESRYFGVGKIEKDQVESYAARKKRAFEEMEKWLSPMLHYK
ncbi:MAG: vitamin B12 dependent-methionine synthase activation domain-containing protein, partial [Bacteroidota bacterium]